MKPSLKTEAKNEADEAWGVIPVEAHAQTAEIINLDFPKPCAPKDLQPAGKIADLAEGIRLAYPEATVRDLPRIIAESEGVSTRTARRWISRWIENRPPETLHGTANRIWSAIKRVADGAGLEPKSPEQATASGKIADLAEGIRLAYPEATVRDLPRIIAESEGVSTRTARRWISRWIENRPPETLHGTANRIWSAIERVADGAGLEPKSPEQATASGKIADLAEGIRLAYPGAAIEDLPRIIAENEGVSTRTARRWISRWIAGQPPKDYRGTANRVWSAIERIADGAGLEPKSPEQATASGKIADLAEGIRLAYPEATVRDLPRIIAENEGVSTRTASRWISRWIENRLPGTLRDTANRVWSAIEGIGSFGHDMLSDLAQRKN